VKAQFIHCIVPKYQTFIIKNLKCYRRSYSVGSSIILSLSIIKMLSCITFTTTSPSHIHSMFLSIAIVIKVMSILHKPPTLRNSSVSAVSVRSVLVHMYLE
jgi:hypothetical protein